jgi:hypothetical protein
MKCANCHNDIIKAAQAKALTNRLLGEKRVLCRKCLMEWLEIDEDHMAAIIEDLINQGCTAF